MTGRSCGSTCAHCGGHYLRGMLTPAEARRLAGSSGVRSWLVSGGCDRTGRVPLLADEALLEELGRRGPLNLHVGLVRSAEEARAAARHAAVVSFDFVVDDATIAEVYDFPGVSAADFVRSFELLAREARVLPHVLIGLRAGRIWGEGQALEELVRLGAPGVVLLVLVPTAGSRFAGVQPPSPSEVTQVIAQARVLFPDRPVQLGCLRPRGGYRAELDVLAVRAGVDRIAVPTPTAVREAVRLGLEPLWSDECCAFDFGEESR